MPYAVSVVRRAQRHLAQLPSADYGRVRDALRALAETPRPVGCVKLTGREAWRIRVGDYRVIYEIDDRQHTVLVRQIRHRRDAYR